MKILDFIKREAVLCISLAAALISMIFVPPNEGYLGYIDWSVLGLLFCLMTAVQGFSAVGAFRKLSGALARSFRNTRTLGALLSLMCFFLSMLVTNDVALLTVVPLTLMLFREHKLAMIRIIILETAAANLGSMATPVGNPQNLFIYSHYQMPLGEFFSTMLPPTVASLVLLAASVILIPSERVTADSGISAEKPDITPTKLRLQTAAYCGMAAVCLLTVARVLDWRICFGIVLALALASDFRVLSRVDYSLLGTFICFFIFVGNISNIPLIKSVISGLVSGREMLVGAALSQVISNVPCAVMLSGFTENARELLLGVDLGGLGTMIASLASLISFKLYNNSEGAKKGRYFAEFTVYNFALLAALFGFQTGYNALFG